MTGLARTPVPLSPTLRFIPYAVDVWCPVLRSADVPAARPVATRLLGQPVVLFRAADQLHALLDRCPHRGVALSLGAVKAGGLQCAYHGWELDASGRVTSIPGVGPPEPAPCVRRFAAREEAGLAWVFAGAADRAASVPIPKGSFGQGLGPELVLSLDIDAHWSFILDNGLDLFHQHLHREVPFFFAVDALEGCGEEAGAFSVRYAATLRDALNRRRQGRIALRLEGNSLALDFAGFPLIRAVPTPRSANGRRVTMWWLVTFPARSLGALALRPLLPRLEAQMLRGFAQDKRVLESEHAAFERDPDAPQLETNPVVGAAHDFLARRILEGARAFFRAARPSAPVERLATADVLARARRGELCVLGPADADDVALWPLSSLAQRLPQPVAPFARYEHFLFALPKDG